MYPQADLDSIPLLVIYIYIPVFGLDVPWRPSDNRVDVAEGFRPLNYRTLCLDVQYSEICISSLFNS